MSKNITTNQIASAVSYQKISFPQKIKYNEEFLDNFKKDITLQLQGEAIEISEENNLIALMMALDAAYKFSPETVLKLETGEKILIFNHQASLILRTDDIIVSFIDEKIDKEKLSGYVESLEINIEEIWQKTKDENYLSRVKKCLDKIKKEIRPTFVITLTGKKPAIIFLLVQYMLYGIAGEIWHQEDKKSKAIKIR
jgi:hypothetical protein